MNTKEVVPRGLYKFFRKPSVEVTAAVDENIKESSAEPVKEEKKEDIPDFSKLQQVLNEKQFSPAPDSKTAQKEAERERIDKEEQKKIVFIVINVVQAYMTKMNIIFTKEIVYVKNVLMKFRKKKNLKQEELRVMTMTFKEMDNETLMRYHINYKRQIKTIQSSIKQIENELEERYDKGILINKEEKEDVKTRYIN